MSSSSTSVADPATRPEPPRLALVILALLGAFAIAVAVFLWQQLLVARSGGSPLCGFGDGEACAALWDSAFASAVHGRTGVPVAGWGLLWGFLAFGFPLLAVRGIASAKALGAIRWVAWAGLASVAVLAGVSLSQGALCVGCIATYVLVGAYAGVVAFGLGGLGVGVSGLGLALGATVAGWLLLLYPGVHTPRSVGEALRESVLAGSVVDAADSRNEPDAPDEATRPSPPVPEASSEEGGTVTAVSSAAGDAPSEESTGVQGWPPELQDQIHRTLWDFVLQLDPQSQQILAEALRVYRTSPAVPVRQPRIVLGNPDAPVHLTDFTDVKCPACADLHANIETFEQALPPGSFSLEPRHFPLDGTCNPGIPQPRAGEQAIRCRAARALICLEDRPQVLPQVQKKLFAEQQRLNTEILFRIVAETAPDLPRVDLEACMRSEATREKLLEDIRYAETHQLRGTPLVLVNGKKASSFGAFLYVILLNRGSAEHPAFERLTPPEPPAPAGPR